MWCFFMNKKFSEKKINEALYKKAVGYEASEVVEEFVVSEEGEFKLNKRKVTKKHISPDLSAVKMLLEKVENKKGKYSEMTDEQLYNEKIKILELLEKLKK